jgi:hypothetical protein
VRRERYFHQTRGLHKAHLPHKIKSSIEDELPTVPFHERVSPTSPDQFHHISQDTRSKIILPVWLNRHEKDPALLVRPFLIQFFKFSDGQLTGLSTTA